MILFRTDVLFFNESFQGTKITLEVTQGIINFVCKPCGKLANRSQFILMYNLAMNYVQFILKPYFLCKIIQNKYPS